MDVHQTSILSVVSFAGENISGIYSGLGGTEVIWMYQREPEQSPDSSQGDRLALVLNNNVVVVELDLGLGAGLFGLA